VVPNLLRLRANYFLKNGERAIFCLKTKTGGLGDGSPPAGSRGGAPVGGLGREAPQKLKQFVHFFIGL